MQQRAKDRSATDAAGLEEELDKKVSWRRPGLCRNHKIVPSIKPIPFLEIHIWEKFPSAHTFDNEKMEA